MMIDFNRLRFLVCLCLLQCVFVTPLSAQNQKVIDTDFSKGQLVNIQNIKYNDLVKFHGHSCDGLLEGMQALQVGLRALYPEEIVDRTNTRIISRSSPCLADAAIYLTGGRYQYNTFYVTDSIPGMYIIQRIDNQRTVIVNRRDKVKPEIIDIMGKQAIAKELPYSQLRKLKQLEEKYSHYLKKSKPELNFVVKELDHFSWNPVLNNLFIKTDVINKNVR